MSRPSDEQASVEPLTRNESDPYDQLEGITKSVSFFRFFSYNTRKDNIMLCIGTLAACIAGLLIPSIAIIMGTIAQNFGDAGINPEEMTQVIARTSSLVAGIAALIAFFSYMFFAFWQHLAENVSLNLRKMYLRALLQQEVAYFEKNKIEEIPAKMGEIFETVQTSIGEKYAGLIFALFQGLGGCLYAFITGKLYAAYLVGYLPVFFIILGTFGIMVKKITAARFEVVQQMGGVVSETLYAIKVVSSFGMEEKELDKFKEWTNLTEKVGKKYQLRFSFMFGIMKFAIFSFYTFSFYLGSQFILNKTPNSNNEGNKPYTPQQVITVLIALITGYISLIAALPNIQALMAAKQVGGEVFAVIDRIPLIKDQPNAVSHFTLKKHIEFHNVTFKYPTAPKEQRNLFENVSFTINAGESTAIVGPSGFGKSTIVQMIERFYQPSFGQINFDGLNIQNIKLKDLRESIGYVPQEPTLIIGTIRENMQFGNKDATDDEIEAALIKANAQFVFDFEKKLDTFIGTSSVVNLSGGQKQRLAIARALLKKPKILILDEATSALDPISEQEVQKAIEQIEKGEHNEEKLTILIIAHRLTSIQDAKNLLFIEKRNLIRSYVKGTKEYDGVIANLKNITYVNAEGEEEEVERERMNSVLRKSQYSGSIQGTEEKGNIYSSSYSLKKAKSMIRGQSFQSMTARSRNSTIRQEILNEFEDEIHIDRQISSKEMMSYYRPSWLAALGIFFSVLASLQLPLFGLLLSKMLFVLMMDVNNPEFVIQRNFWIGMFAALTVGMFISSFMQKLSFGYCSENLVKTIRLKLFEAILYKHIGWFDNKNRAPGVLGSIVQEDIQQLNGLTSEVYSVAIESILGILVSSGLCLYFSWQIGFIAIVLSPLMVFGGFFMSSFQWSQGKVDDAYIESNALLSDIIMNYRTIISLGEKNVDYILGRYYNLLDEPNRQGIKRAHFSGVLYGYSQSIRFVFVALSFYFAALIIEKFNMNADQKNDVFTAVYIMFVGAIGAGVSVSQMPSKSRAQRSANKIFGIIEEESRIDSRKEGEVKKKEITSGMICFENVSFKYPSRDKKILENLDLIIKGNESVALVGHSGSGKSTIASLLLRYYNKQGGKIKIDGVEIEKMSVKQLRQQIAIVMQEPLLFNEPIKENIRYGNSEATDEQIYLAAEQANCLSFIQNNIDALCVPEVKDQIENDFKKLMQKLTQQYPKFTQIQKLKLTIEEVFMLKELLENASDAALQLIDKNTDIFIQRLQGIVQKDNNTQELNWKNHLMGFVWQVNQLPQMLEVIKEAHISEFLIDDRDYERLLNFAKVSNWKFDFQILKEYLDYIQDPSLEPELSETMIDTQSQSNVVSFNYFIKKYQNKKRIKALYDSQVEIMIKSDAIINKSKQPLHPGFNKLCGLRGCRLSGGQKQRVAIARALIRNPRILILDEATSALDEKSQEVVQEALEEAMKGRTSIVIAHRLSTVKKCNRIVVLNNGKVIEQGTYKELSEDPNSHFFRLKAGLQDDE